MDYWPDSMLTKLKLEIERRAGVKFRLCTGDSNLRATFCQMAVDAVVQSGYRDAAAIEPVSVAMRHRSLVTTQRYYGRLKRDQAFATIKDAFRLAVQK